MEQDFSSEKTNPKKENTKIKQVSIVVEDDKQIEQETSASQDKKQAEEFGGPKGLEPTRYGDWEKRGRCIDF